MNRLDRDREEVVRQNGAILQAELAIAYLANIDNIHRLVQSG